MLMSCSYCGRIHDSTYVCIEKEKAMSKRKTKLHTDSNKFRGRHAWRKKRKEIRERDCVCQICVRGLYDPVRKYETEDLSVHHIVPLVEDYCKRLDNENLITLCARHHEMAENGKIPRDLLKKNAIEREKGPPGTTM